jgi:hypothetical protein
VTRSGHVRFHQSITGLLQDINTLKPHPENANNGDVDAIVESILVNGFYPQPIVVNEDTNEIVIGNHRYFALMELGSELAPVLYIDSDAEATLRIMLADNRINDLRRYDMGQLKNLLERLSGTDTGLKGTGFADDYLQKLAEGDRRSSEAIADANAKRDPVPTGTGGGIMFLEVTDEDRTRFNQLTEGSSDTERFHYLLDLAEDA